MIQNYRADKSVIYSGDGNDTIYNLSNSHYVKIDGGSDADYILNMRGTNIIIDGGSGNDTLGGTNSTVDDGTGEDRLIINANSVSNFSPVTAHFLF